MANRYVKSSAAGANNGTSWADAYTSLASAATAAVAGDTIYVHHTHSQSFGATNTTLTFGNSRSNLVRVISVNDALEPTLGAYAGCTNANCIVAGSCYVWGIDFSSSTYGASQVVPPQGGYVVLDKCTVGNTTGAGSALLIGGTAGQARVRFVDVTWKVNGTSCKLDIRAVDFSWDGGAVNVVSGTPTVFASLGSNVYTPTTLAFRRLDLSQLPVGITLATSTADTLSPMECRFARCKLPAGWAGQLSDTARIDARMDSCDDAGSILRSQINTGPGAIYTDAAISRTGGAALYGTPISWRMATNATAGEKNPLTSFDIFRAWPGTDAEVAGWTAEQALTLTVEVVTDGVTLKDSECWMEVLYFDSAGSTLGSSANDGRASVLAAAADQPSSTAEWVSTGLAAPIKQSLSVTVHPGAVGYVMACVHLGRPSTTVYVCPALEVS